MKVKLHELTPSFLFVTAGLGVPVPRAIHYPDFGLGGSFRLGRVDLSIQTLGELGKVNKVNASRLARGFRSFGRSSADYSVN